MINFTQTLLKDAQTRRFEIVSCTEGWQVVERADSRIVRNELYTDWHRVERARRAFAIEVSSLRAEGWTEGEGC